MDVNNINVLVLAYLGDTVYEYYVRDFLVRKNISNVNDLQKESLNFVSAKSQAKFLERLIEDNKLSDNEITIIKRARNHKSNHCPKNCDIVTYKCATGLESLIGYLKITKNILLNFIILISLK